MTKKWGPPTWLLIHSLYSHVSQEKFFIHYKKINSLVSSILQLLPCEYCKKHALDYLKSHGFSIHENNIEKQRNFFYTFHNDVNKKLHKPIFTNFEIYSRSNLNRIVKLFNSGFSSNYYNMRSLGINLHRKLISKKIIDVLNEVFRR